MSDPLGPDALARAIARDAIAAIDVDARVRDTLPPLPPNRARVTVAAIGKGAPRMARAALDRWGDRIDDVWVVTTDATDASMIEGIEGRPRVRVLRAAHPLPDARSVDAAEQLLTAAKREASDLLVALISGGASSLVCAPALGISLDEKRAVIDAMLRSGAPIRHVNVVRRHLSRIKGGGIAIAAMPGRTLSLIASDVLVEEADRGEPVEGSASDIGSGPSVADPTTIEDAQRALERWASSFVPRIAPLLCATLSLTDDRARRTRSHIVVAPHDLVEAAAAAARTHGLSVEVLGPSLATVDTLAVETVEAAKHLRPRSIRVRVAEPSVILPAGTRGRGGRAGRLALAVWCGGLPADVAFAAAASDGVDGSSKMAGAVVGGALDAAALAEARVALDAYDDAPFLEARDRSIDIGPTGINLLDLNLLVRG